MRPELPWRLRQRSNALKRTWWRRILASRTIWGIFGGSVVWVLSNGVESLTNLQKFPSEIRNTYHLLQSWYFDDELWTGIWSSREEGDIEDHKQAELPLKLDVNTKRGKVFGEMFNRSVCALNPLLPPVFVEGEIGRGKLVATAFAYVDGERNFLYSFSASRSEKEPVITLSPLQDPLGLMPPNARLVRRLGAGPIGEAALSRGQEAKHPDLECPESPTDYLQRLRREAGLKGVGERGRGLALP